MSDSPQLSTPNGTAEAEKAARHRARLANHHWLMLAGSVTIVVLACLLQIRPDQRIQLRWGPPLPLPELCASKVYWGIECPGCGLTRSCISLARGDFWQAWYLNRFSWLLAIVLLAQFPYRLWSLWMLERRGVSTAKWPDWFGYALVLVLVGNWLLRMFGI